MRSTDDDGYSKIDSLGYALPESSILVPTRLITELRPALYSHRARQDLRDRTLIEALRDQAKAAIADIPVAQVSNDEEEVPAPSGRERLTRAKHKPNLDDIPEADIIPNLSVKPKDELAPEITSLGMGHMMVPCVDRAHVRELYIACLEKFDGRGSSKITLTTERRKMLRPVIAAMVERSGTRKVRFAKDGFSVAFRRMRDALPHMSELITSLEVPFQLAEIVSSSPVVQPILLVGAPGIGKTHAARQVAEILGLPSHTVSYSAAGMTGHTFSGGDRGWSEADPGLIFSSLAVGEYANPVFILDEIDKASKSHTNTGTTREPLGELLTLLERSTAKDFKDRTTDLPIDASRVIWIATCNSLAGIPAPLLSRFKIIFCKRPEAREAVMISKLIAKSVSKDLGIEVSQPTGGVLQFLATLTPRTIDRIWRAAAALAVIGGRDRVSMSDVHKAVGSHEIDPADQMTLH